MESALERSRRLEQEAKKNRERMPEVGKILDEFRSVFGGSVRLIYAEENGLKAGTKAKGNFVQASVIYKEEKKNGRSKLALSRAAGRNNRLFDMGGD